MSGRPVSFVGHRNVDGARWFTKAFVDDPRWPDDVGLAVSNAAAQVAFQSGDYLRAGSFVRGGLDRLDRIGGGMDSSDIVRFWGAYLCRSGAMLAIGATRADLWVARPPAGPKPAAGRNARRDA